MARQTQLGAMTDDESSSRRLHTDVDSCQKGEIADEGEEVEQSCQPLHL